jgi:membrane-bound serine protease (ClpP class)
MQFFFVSLLAGLILFGAEIFVPGGILGTVGALALAGAIVSGFYAFPQHGALIAIAIFFLLGAALFLWARYFPKSRVGRQMTASRDLARYRSGEAGLDELTGKNGVATSDLRPSGYCSIDGRRVDVVTSGEMVTQGSAVRVVEVKGNRVVVEAA